MAAFEITRVFGRQHNVNMAWLFHGNGPTLTDPWWGTGEGPPSPMTQRVPDSDNQLDAKALKSIDCFRFGSPHHWETRSYSAVWDSLIILSHVSRGCRHSLVAISTWIQSL
ncbi:hypothetical protein [Absidia glauca]|uniref:Uncharacterized protein n=1 Tax=Absidia glauca TaxID=4829 RepID=A0A163TCZ2_ABSGL|nr:hypothetical protein [Absidia glauca]